MSKIAGIIPARWASTRFPGKPLHPIAGKPLLQHVWERCCETSRLDAVIVATDDLRIAEAAFAFGAEVALTSPGCPSGTDRVAEVAARLDKRFSAVINIQGDEPTISPALIDQLAAALKKNPRLPMVTAASVLRNRDELGNPNCVKVTLAINGDALYFSRSVIPFPSADVEGGIVYYRHQGIYGYRRDFLKRFVRWAPSAYERIERLEQLRALERGIRIRVLIAGEEALGVDAPADVARAEERLAAMGKL